MRRIFGESASPAMIALPSLLFRPAAFFVRMCLANEWRRLTFPVAVNLKRLAAPLWVFSFMSFLLLRSHPPMPVLEQISLLNWALPSSVWLRQLPRRKAPLLDDPGGLDQSPGGRFHVL